MIVDQINDRWWFKLNGFMRWAMARGLPGFRHRPVVITEYPKSGGTWMSQMLSEYLGIPHPRNRLPPATRSIIHGVYRRVSPANDTVLVWRDGRDVMVSYYFHILFEKPANARWHKSDVMRTTGIEDPDNVERNLPRFIEASFEGRLYPGYSWTDFHQNWKARSGHLTTSYEAMSRDPCAELHRLLEGLVDAPIDRARIQECVEKYSFEAQTGRKKGEEDPTTFIRKGVVGDWRHKFTRQAREVFDHYAGETLIELGYEADRSWVDKGVG